MFVQLSIYYFLVIRFKSYSITIYHQWIYKHLFPIQVIYLICPWLFLFKSIFVRWRLRLECNAMILLAQVFTKFQDLLLHDDVLYEIEFFIFEIKELRLLSPIFFCPSSNLEINIDTRWSSSVWAALHIRANQVWQLFLTHQLVGPHQFKRCI